MERRSIFSRRAEHVKRSSSGRNQVREIWGPVRLRDSGRGKGHLVALLPRCMRRVSKRCGTLESDFKLRHALSYGRVATYLCGRAIERARRKLCWPSRSMVRSRCVRAGERTRLKTLQAALERGVRRVTEGISLLRAEVLDARDWKRFDSAGRLFWNMNTAADYEEARRIVEAEQS